MKKRRKNILLEFKTINQFQREENETQNNFQNYTETLQRTVTSIHKYSSLFRVAICRQTHLYPIHGCYLKQKL